MNSTKKEYLVQVEQFFCEKLVPLAKKLHSDDESIFFQKKPDSAQETYFIKRKAVTMTPEDFERGGCKSSEDLAAALASLWKTEGYIELSALADAIVDLSDSVRQTEEEQGSEVSPFIYVMF